MSTRLRNIILAKAMLKLGAGEVALRIGVSETLLREYAIDMTSVPDNVWDVVIGDGAGLFPEAFSRPISQHKP